MFKFLLYYANKNPRMNKNISFSYYNSKPIERLALLDVLYQVKASINTPVSYIFMFINYVYFKVKAVKH